MFDIGANRGDATWAGLNKGFTVVAVEPGAIYNKLAQNFMYNSRVTTLKYAASDVDYKTIEFYEAAEDGLSSINKDWLTKEGMPYNNKPFKTTLATTITIDTLVKKYGLPDLIKIDVEGAEWLVFRGMTKKYGQVTFEWTDVTLPEHEKQLQYLASLGYKEFALRYIEEHLKEPEEDNWVPITESLKNEWEWSREHWQQSGWKVAGLRPTADVGMCWVR